MDLANVRERMRLKAYWTLCKRPHWSLRILRQHGRIFDVEALFRKHQRVCEACTVFLQLNQKLQVWQLRFIYRDSNLVILETWVTDKTLQRELDASLVRFHHRVLEILESKWAAKYRLHSKALLRHIQRFI
jgi:hypothetical protein